MLAKFDITPLQVLIEGAVIEITLRYGLQYFLEFSDVTAIFSRDSSQTTVNPTVPGFGRTISGSNNSKLVIHALSDLSDVRVVSSPQLLVVDGETARLHVGDQVPIVTLSSSTSVTDVARMVNEIEYRDTGVTLHDGIRCPRQKIQGSRQRRLTAFPLRPGSPVHTLASRPHQGVEQVLLDRGLAIVRAHGQTSAARLVVPSVHRDNRASLGGRHAGNPHPRPDRPLSPGRLCHAGFSNQRREGRRAQIAL